MSRVPPFRGDASQYLVDVAGWLEREAIGGKWTESAEDALDEALLAVRDTFTALGDSPTGPDKIEFWAALRFVSAACAARAATGSLQEKLSLVRNSLLDRFGEEDPLYNFVQAALASNDLLLIRAAWAAVAVREHEHTNG